MHNTTFQRTKHVHTFILSPTLFKWKTLRQEVHAWEKNNLMVVAWLHNVINKSLHGSIAYAEKASEIWTYLKERYLQNNEIRIHQLRQEVTITKQGNLTMSEYFTKLKGLSDELGARLQLPHCNCAKEYNFSKH